MHLAKELHYRVWLGVWDALAGRFHTEGAGSPAGLPLHCLGLPFSFGGWYEVSMERSKIVLK